MRELQLPGDGRPRVAVIGGGVSGLAAAYRLQQLDPAVKTTIFEADDRLGGKIKTERFDDFVIEGGPDSFLAAKPRGVGLATELGLADDLQAARPAPHRASVLHGDRLFELPEGLSGLVPTSLGPLFHSGLLSARGKARLALDLVLPARVGESDESLGAFIRRRLGPEAYTSLIEPLMAGIYAGDGDRLSLLATFPQLRRAEQEHGSLLRGVRAARATNANQASGPARPAFLTPKTGLQTLVDTLAERLRAGGARFVLQTPIRAITSRSGEGVLVTRRSGEQRLFDAAIVATPAHVAGDLLAGVDAMLTADLRAIPHASTAIVTLALPRSAMPGALAGHGYLVPRASGSPILACTWSSEKWANRAPDGWLLLRVFVGRFGQEAVLAGTDEELLAVVRTELKARLGIAADPRFWRVQRWPQGMPQYVLGHPARLHRIDAALGRTPWLSLAGNGYRGVGLPDCIASGEAAAARTLAWLASDAGRAVSGVGVLAAAS